jgi:hypothetical protein
VLQRAPLHNTRLAEYHLLRAIGQGWHRPTAGRFSFRGKQHATPDAGRLLAVIEEELAQDQAWLAEFDRNVFRIYSALAWQLDPTTADELLQRYRFHLELQRLCSSLRELGGLAGWLKRQRPAPPDSREALSIARQLAAMLGATIQAAGQLVPPPLPHLSVGGSLQSLLLDEPIPSSETKVPALLTQFRRVQQRLERVQRGSLVAILTLQQRLGERAEQHLARFTK